MSEAKRLSEPSLTRIKDWVRDQGFQIGPKSIADLLSHIAALEAELAAAKAECERLRVFERAMESMAAQMIHPKMTALEMANMQLEEPTS